MKIMLTLFSFFLFISCGGSMTDENNTESPTIIEYGTKEFDDFVQSVNISPQEAYEKVLISIENNPEGKYAKLLYICINNEYHFTMHANKVNYISLSGFYVDATTGNVRFIQQNERYKLKHMGFSTYFKPQK